MGRSTREERINSLVSFREEQLDSLGFRDGSTSGWFLLFYFVSRSTREKRINSLGDIREEQLNSLGLINGCTFGCGIYDCLCESCDEAIDGAVYCCAGGRVSALVICYFIQVVFTGQVFDCEGDLVYIC